jgi:hypothetical protein
MSWADSDLIGSGDLLDVVVVAVVPTGMLSLSLLPVDPRRSSAEDEGNGSRAPIPMSCV